ncbi:LemA family protein [Melaminivora sp.]|uniref:LemA family protein n=1 Tax=Melaminivora sp. TaxID=1933032 RepID=UPI0028A69FF9|nr:LemA family protein [Melaminivora sp.]
MTFLLWTSSALAAVLLFWGVGAYQRLVRLRAAVLKAFAALETQLARLLALMAEFDAGLEAQAPVGEGEIHAQRQAVQAAAAALRAALAAARARPLDALAIAALARRARALNSAWAALVQAPALQDEGVAAPSLAPWVQQREELALQGRLARQQFNTAVTRYNEAVAQFPAGVLAWCCGFRKGRVL